MGTRDGAGIRPLKQEHAKDADYTKGYSDGCKAKQDYAISSANELGVVVREIVLMKGTK